MKNQLILLLAFVVCPCLARGEFRSGEQSQGDARQVIRHTGSANLSNGLYFETDESLPAAASFIRFFQDQEGIPVNRTNPGRKNVWVGMSRVDALSRIPAGSRDGYQVRITPGQITIEFVTPRGASAAVRILQKLYLQEKAIRKGRKKLLPCYEILGWSVPEEMTPFRLTNNPFHTTSELVRNIEELLPPEAYPVGWMMTDPVRGWLIPGESLRTVGYTESIHSGDFYTYSELRELSAWMEEYGVSMVPTFDLLTPNARFEAVTGHPMLSVEGFRFVRALLEEFFRASGQREVCFIVPSGKYRTRLEELAAGFDSVVSIRFLDK